MRLKSDYHFQLLGILDTNAAKTCQDHMARKDRQEQTSVEYLNTRINVMRNSAGKGI